MDAGQSRRWMLMLLLGVLLSACQPESVVVLPTVMVLPTETFTPTPLPTDKPTATPALTATPTATATSTRTHTPTFTATLTRTHTRTPFPTGSPTSTITFTPSRTNTPLATNTPVPTATSTATLTPVVSPTLPGPVITSFAASASNVLPNGSLTLVWASNADSARIDVLNAQGTVTNTFNVVPTGQLPVTVPGNLGRLIIYRLVAIRNTQQVTQNVGVTILCEHNWFFGNEFAPADATCPTAVGAIGEGRFQGFERGFMVYINANGANRVYGMDSTGRYISYFSTWDGTTTYSCYSAPPTGLFEPQGIFNWAYCNTNAPIGGWATAIGWASGTINTDDRTVQYEQGTTVAYIDTPVGVIRFIGGEFGTWQRIK
jgi:hypothetical protein